MMGIIHTILNLLGIHYTAIILILTLLVLLTISIFGNVGLNWSTKTFTFGSSKKDKQRSCRDCITTIHAKRVIFEGLYNTKHNSILKLQMTFAEHKLQEIQTSIGKQLDKKVQDDIRRSAKENGFEILSEEQFKQYIIDRQGVLSFMIGDESNNTKNIIEEIYKNMREVKTRISNELKDLEVVYIDDINQYCNQKD